MFSAVSLLLSTALVAFSKFDVLFSFSFNSKYFVISLLISSLTHRLFRCMFSFQVYGDFLKIFLYDSNPFRCIETHFMAQNMVILGKCLVCP